MKLKYLFIMLLAAVIIGCGRSDNQTPADDKNKTQSDKNSDQTLQVSSGDKSIEIHTSGMTCTGCENTIKTKVKKVNGVTDVIADYKSNVVKASFDPGKTNSEAISEVIKSAGYEVLTVK